MGEFRRLGLEDHTLVVLTADHGEGLLQHRELTHGYYVYDSTLRVPLILRCPSRVPEERVIDSQVQTVDIAPTVLAFLGLEPGPDVQGQSLLPLAEGAADDLRPAAYGESVSAHDSYGYARLRTCRTDGWKYIHAPKPELYDIENDPHETVNLADRYPERVATMRYALEELIAESLTGAADMEQVGVLDAVAAEKLAGLGYVGGYSPESSTKNELELFSQFEGPDPKDHVDSFNRFLAARAWINSDQPANAEPMLHGLISAEPSAPAFRDYYAKLLQKLGRPEEAVEQYRSLLELQPDNAVAHYRLGKVFGELGRLDDSVTHLRRAADAMPEYAEAHAYLALALAQQGRLQEAEGCFRRVLELDPANEDACTELSALLQRRGLGEQAVGILREGLRRRPDSLKLSNNLAWFLATAPDPELRDGQEAVRLVWGIRQRMPEDDASILDTLAAAYAAAGRFDEAVISARRALDLVESLELVDLATEVRARLALYESGRAYYAQP